MPPKGRCAAAAAQAPGTARPLYEVVGVAEDATPADLQKAFRLRALQVHPDKNPGDEGAKEAFQKLQHAYETLKDPERRRVYDATGLDGEGADDAGVSAADAARVRSFFKPVDTSDIDAFVESYKGSAQERADVAEFVRQRNGDVTLLLDYIMCSEPSDVDRLLALVQQTLGTGEVPAKCKNAVESTTPKLRKRAAAQEKRNAKERVSALSAAKAQARTIRADPGALSPTGGSLASLAEAIRGRQQARWASSLVDQLEAKYAPQVGKRALPGQGALPAPGAAKKRAKAKARS